MLVRETLSDAFSALVLDLLDCSGLSGQSILVLLTSKRVDSKQSEVHLAILDAHNSIVSIGPLYIKDTIMIPDKERDLSGQTLRYNPHTPELS